MGEGPTGREPVVAIVGPTCSGKTRIAVELARSIRGEIVSADARQAFKLLDVGTAKPTTSEMRDIPHHLVSFLSLEDEISAGVYAKLARDAVEEIFARGRRPIIVGGSGLYIRAIADGLFDAPDVKREVRAELRNRLHEEGAEKLLAELKEVDPDTAKGLLHQNYKRILRALEIYYSSGKRISDLQEDFPSRPNFDTVQFGIIVERQELYRRIEKRVDEMISNGLVEEVKGILKKGFDPSLNSLQTVGYRETIEYLNGGIKFEEMVDLIKMNTRRYAKRQMTWFKKDNRIIWIDSTARDAADAALEIRNNLLP